jgi:hypothetical protein
MMSAEQEFRNLRSGSKQDPTWRFLYDAQMTRPVGRAGACLHQ